MTKPFKPGEVTITHQESTPGQQEMDTLVSLFNHGRYTEVVNLAQGMTGRFPWHGFGWMLLGAAFKQMGRAVEALVPMQKAAELSPGNADAYSNLGVTFHELGRLDEAEAALRQAIRINPANAAAYNNLGNTLHELGRLGEAEASYRHALQINPNYAQAHFNLGNTAKELGRLKEAEACYRQALQLSQGYAKAHNNLGAILHDLGRLDEAEVSYRHALQINPGYAEAHSNLGATLKEQDKLEEAEASYRRALQVNPDLAEACNNLGAVLRKTGRLDEAENCFRRALQIKPDYAEARSNLGTVLKETGRLGEAEANLQQVLQINPDTADAHYNLGNILKDMGRLEEAESSYRRALQIDPDHVEASLNLGVVLHDLGRLIEAEASYRRVLKIRPEHADAYNNLGNTLKDMGRLEEAEVCLQRAIDIRPSFVNAYCNLGAVLQGLGRPAEAEANYRHALEADPDSCEVYSNLLFLLNCISGADPASSFAEAREYGRKASEKAMSRFEKWVCTEQPKRLRVGIVSGDLRSHPVGYFLEGLLGRLGTISVELFAYPTCRMADELTARIKPHFSSWKPLYNLNDEAAARLIHADGIHVLIDLSGHTRYNRLPLFAWKPAPVQATWLGYLGTTGVAEIDYLIADPWTLPETEEAFFTEKIWRLPESYLCFTPPDKEVEVASLPAFANGYVTFGCFNNLTKVSDEAIVLWSRILASVPDSRLFLKAKQLGEASVRQRTIERFAVHGIDADRLVLEGLVPTRSEHLATYGRVDIALDPFPYPGITTTVEALWMGVPVLTLAGESFLSRQGVGILMNAGLQEWIAADADDYVARALSHAGDLHRLPGLRNGLRQQVSASPVMDAQRFAAHLEAALWGMWRAGYEKQKK